MLKSLYISNYAIIDELNIEFSEGLNTITGETGAGKSIMTGALNLILGERADTNVLFDNNSNCIVEGQFLIEKYSLYDFFEQHDLEYSPELIVRRVIYASGKSRAFVNDQPTTLKVLRTLMTQLIQQHRQFDTLDINSTEYQLELLDALASHDALLNSYRNHYEEFAELRSILARKKNQKERLKSEQDFIRFQLDEILKLEIEEDELEELETTLSEMENAEEIKSSLAVVSNIISEQEPSVSEMLRTLKNQLDSISDFYEPAREFSERIHSVMVELDDISATADDRTEDIEYSHGEIEEKRSRLDSIYKLVKKHNVESSNDLLRIADELEDELSDYSAITDEIEKIEKNISHLQKTLFEEGNKLHTNRKSVTEKLRSKVEKILNDLAMEDAQLVIPIEKLDQPGPNGIDKVDFKFSANRGSQLSSIKNVASGGELSRLALALKSIVARAMTLPSLVFDEIDQGVSGDISLKMAHILRRMSGKHQIIVITHSAQIAAQGDKHFFVYKESNNERTFTKIHTLENTERVEQLAIMLSKKPPTEAALANAEELLKIQI